MLSVVMPNYNHSKFLPKALDAIFSQSLLPDEVIVVDDASTDRSIDVITEYSKKYSKIRLLKNEKNMGVVASLNKGLKEVKGEFVHCAGADDKVLPGLYEKSIALLSQCPAAGYCSSLSGLIDEDGNDLGLFSSIIVKSKPSCISPKESLVKLWRYGSWIMGNSAIYRTSILKGIGYFPLHLESYNDAFCGDLLALKHGACFIPERLVDWRRLEKGYSSQTSNQIPKMIHLINRICELMKNEYAAYFSSEYIRLWKRRELLGMVRQGTILRLSSHELEMFVREFPSLKLLDVLYFKLIGISKVWGRLLSRSYIMLQGNIFQSMNALRRFYVKTHGS